MDKEEKKEYNRQYSIKNKEAISANKRAYLAANGDKIRAYRKSYYENNKADFIASQRAYYASDKGRRVRLIAKAKERADKVGLDFNIGIEDIPLPSHCPFLGLELTHVLGEGQLPSNSSIDRIDSSLGYIKGNVQVISRLANTMKTNATPEQLVAFAEGVLKIYKGAQGDED